MTAAFQYIYIVAKNSADQKKKVVFQMVNHAIFLLFNLYLYKYVYSLLPSLSNKIPYVNAIWSMSMYFALYWLGLRNIEKTIRDDIHSGNVEIYFLRPLGYLWQKIWIQLGEGLVPFITAALLSFLVNYFFVGLPTIDVSYGVWALGIVVIFFMSQTVTVLLFVLCGLAGFWIENSEPLYFVVSKLIMVFGGAWVPVAFFPKAVQIVAEFSPFGASASVIYAMYPNFSQHFVVMCLNMIGWSMILVIITYVVSRRAYRNMAVNG